MTLFEFLDSQGRAVLAIAQTRAREMGHDYVGTEHLVAAIVEESQ